MRILLKLTVMSALLCLAFIPATAERMRFLHSMPSLAREADQVALVEVIAIASEGAVRIAQARVREAWKGNPGKELFFYASPSWTCDYTRAEVGWTLLLFLVRRPHYPAALSIMSSGDGEFSVVKDDKGEFVVTADMEPEELSTTEVVGPNGVKMKAVPVAVLREYLQDLLRSLDNKK